MKLLQRTLTLLALAISFEACAGDNNPPQQIDPADEEQENNTLETSLDGSKTIVVYFSCTNTTKGVADKISAVLGCNEWRIVPKQQYTSSDLDYNDNSSRANKEQNDDSARPAINGSIDISKYEVVYVGFPIWWGKLPKILWTFFDTYNLSGKTIIPFCTSGSSGISTAVGEIRKLETSATVMDGRRFSGSDSEAIIRSWVNSVQPKQTTSMKMNIEVNGHILTATLADNSSANALAQLMKNSAITIEMSDYGDFEKVGKLPKTLPSSDTQITTQPGDIMLYQSNQMVIFYGSNSWAYTRLGKIDNVTPAELKQLLGSGNVTVTLKNK